MDDDGDEANGFGGESILPLVVVEQREDVKQCGDSK